MVLIDVKHRRLYPDSNAPYFILDRRDAERLLTTEHLLGKPVLLLYKNNADPNGIWYAQLLSDALHDDTTEQARDFYKMRADCFQPLADYLLEGQITVAQLQKNLFN